MKHKSILLTLTFILFCLAGQAQNSIFDKLSDRKDIQTVHVSKSLLDMLTKMPTGGVDIAHLADKLKQIDVYSSEAADAIKFMNSEAAFFAKDKSYETFLNIKEGEQTNVFYGKKSGNNFKDLVMVSNEKDKCTIVRLVGDFDAKDIQQIVKKKEKGKEK